MTHQSLPVRPWGRPSSTLLVGTFLLLLALTGSTWWTNGHGGAVDRIATVAFALAMAKMLIIGWVFMDVRSAPRMVVVAFVGWCAVTSLVVLGLLMT